MAVKAKYPAQVIVQCSEADKAKVRREATQRVVSEAEVGRDLFALGWAAREAGFELVDGKLVQSRQGDMALVGEA